MATVPSDGFFSRVGRSWNDFWFKPGSPHTLCMMRVFTGIFVFYLHFAYTRDLQTFFGKHGWVDLELANDVRNEYPVMPPQTGWAEPETNMRVPYDRDVRAAFFEWLTQLPADRGQRKQILNFLYLWIPADTVEGANGLALIQRLRIKPLEGRGRPTSDEFEFATPDERNQLLNAITNLPSNAEERDKTIPKYMQQLHKDGYAPRVRADAERFAMSLPNDSKKIAQIIGHMAYQSTIPVPQRKSHREPRTELERTLTFIDEDLPAERAERVQVLKYFDRWGLDERKLLAKGQNGWSIWFHVTNPTAMYVIHFLFLGVMAMFALGLFTRVTSVLTWLAALCYVHRTTQVLFGMDVMMNICLIYLMLSPCGALYSLDRFFSVRKARRQLEEAKRTGQDTTPFERVLAAPAPSVSANFVSRLYQIHFCFIYMAAGLSKLKGNAWWNHTAGWGTIANPEFSPTIFAPYRWVLTELADTRWLWELGMSGIAVFTLLLEIGLPFLIWRPRLRPLLVITGVLFHMGIGIFMGLTVFGLFMMVLLFSYVPPEAVRKWIDSGMSLFGKSPSDKNGLSPPEHVLSTEGQKLNV